MKIFRMLFWCLPVMALFLPMKVQGQVKVSCELNYKKYLLFEPVLAKVTIQNISGRRLVLGEGGKEAALLSLDIRNSRNYLADRRNTVALLDKQILLENQETRSLLIYVNSAYIVNKIDSYTVKARVQQGDYVYTSKKCFFDTYEGTVVSRIVTRNPARTYTMRKISRSQKGMFLYVRVDDPDGNTNYGVQILDTMVPVYKPRMVLDEKGRLHTLHRKSPQQYAEVVINPNGREVERHYFRPGFGEVNFMRDEAGQIRVSGVVKIGPE